MPSDILQDFLDENDERIDALIQTFDTYQPQAVSRAKLIKWLGQFDPTHYEIALRLLETVEFYDLPRMHALLSDLHEAVKEQLGRDGVNWNNVYFVPLGSAGESGHEIARRYRDVNKINPAKLKLVPELQEIIFAAAKKRVQLALVFLDDFIGSGKQITDYWKDDLPQIVSFSPRPAMYVGCCVACPQGAAKVRETPLQVLAVHYVPDRLRLASSNVFSTNEKQVIRDYCNTAGNKPQGFGDLELMMAFAHGAPNNVLSVLRGSKRQRPWRGILPRFDDL